MLEHNAINNIWSSVSVGFQIIITEKKVRCWKWSSAYR
jgi:hypothetical protein